MKKITTLHIEGKKFEIVKHSGFYCAVNHAYLDDNGCLTQALNGLQLMASHTLNECIDRVTKSIKIENLQKEGKSLEDALKIAYNL